MSNFPGLGSPPSRDLSRLSVTGSPFDRGRKFGEARRVEIAAFTRDWLESLQRAGIASPLEYLDRMLAETNFPAAIRRFAPDLLDEVDGIVAGCELPRALVLAAQCMDEEWAYRLRTKLSAEIPEKCSTIALRGHDQDVVWIGQNMDLGDYTDGHQLALQVGADGTTPGARVFTIGSMIALMGINELQVAVCVNALPQLESSSSGLPVGFVTRRLLQCRTASEAAELVQRIDHASGQHYAIADPTQIRSFEASAAGVAEFEPPQPGRLLHTNHPLAAAKQREATPHDATNSLARLQSLMGRLLQGTPTRDAVFAALSACDDPRHPVCREADPNRRVSPITGTTNFTTGSMVAALRSQADGPECWMSAGPPASRGYVRIGPPVQGARE